MCEFMLNKFQLVGQMPLIFHDITFPDAFFRLNQMAASQKIPDEFLLSGEIYAMVLAICRPIVFFRSKSFQPGVSKRGGDCTGKISKRKLSFTIKAVNRWLFLLNKTWLTMKKINAMIDL